MLPGATDRVVVGRYMGFSFLHLGKALKLSLWNDWLLGGAAHTKKRKSYGFHGFRILVTEA